MDHIAKLVISGVGSIANMEAQDVYMLDDNGTAPCPSPFVNPCQDLSDPAIDLLEGVRGYQLMGVTLVLAILVAWVRRSTNQRAVLLGFGVESALSMVHAVAILVLFRSASACFQEKLGVAPPTTTALVANVLQLLARLAQSCTGILAGCSQNQKLGMAFTGSCVFYFLVWFVFETYFTTNVVCPGGADSCEDGDKVFSFMANVTALFDGKWKDFSNALARSVPGALAGIILFIQRAPASGEETEMA